MNAQEQEQMVAARAAVEQDVKDRLQWEIENAERREKTAIARIKNNESSDWALLDDMATAYAQRAVTRYQRWALDGLNNGIPAWKVLGDLLDRVTEDVMMYRGARSSSRGSNAISEETHVLLLKWRESVQTLLYKAELVKEQ